MSLCAPNSAFWIWQVYTAKQLACQPLYSCHFGLVMSWAHSITTPCTCMNNTSYTQPKVVQQPKIPAPRGKEWQRGVGTLELLAVCDRSTLVCHLWNMSIHYIWNFGAIDQWWLLIIVWLSHGLLLSICRLCLSNCQGQSNCISYCILYLNDQFWHTYLYIETT